MSLLHNEIDYLQTVLRETFRLCIYSQSLSESQRRSLDESYNILLDAHFEHFRERILTQAYSRNAPSIPDVAPSSFPQVVVTKSEQPQQQHQPPTLEVGETLFEPTPVSIKVEPTYVKTYTVSMPEVVSIPEIVKAVLLREEIQQNEVREQSEEVEAEAEVIEEVEEDAPEEEVVQEEEAAEEEVVEEEEAAEEENVEEEEAAEEEESEIVKIGKKKYFVGVKTRTVNIYIDDETMGETLGQLKDGKIIPLA